MIEELYKFSIKYEKVETYEVKENYRVLRKDFISASDLYQIS